MAERLGRLVFQVKLDFIFLFYDSIYVLFSPNVKYRYINILVCDVTTWAGKVITSALYRLYFSIHSHCDYL